MQRYWWSKRNYLIFSLFVVVIAWLPSTAQAQDELFIQIKNSLEIVTQAGQVVEIVVEFGNRGDQLSENIYIGCLWDFDLGSPGEVQPRPFRFFRTSDATEPSGGLFTFDRVEFGGVRLSPFDHVLIDRLTLLPGQNHTVAFQINITPRGNVVGSVVCTLHTRNESEPLFTFRAETNEHTIFVPPRLSDIFPPPCPKLICIPRPTSP